MTPSLDRVQRTSFGTEDGPDATLFRVANARGMEMRVTDYGGILTALTAPDAHGRFDDVVLGFDTLADYCSDRYRAANPYFGALIGRYGNRIAEGRFRLDGSTYTLATNDGPNHLHGGKRGFDQRRWDAEPFAGEDRAGVVLRYVSPDGEEGYPGTLTVKATYALTDQNELAIDYRATATAATPVNLTHHSYFNLAGAASGNDILDHQVMINADRFTPVDETLIPTGELRAVHGTPFDFTQATPVGRRIHESDRQLRYAEGYDHNFVLNAGEEGSNASTPAAQIWEPESGRLMSVRTTEPGLQFYSGNQLQGTLAGKGGASYAQHAGLALETQHFPNTPNIPSFPSTVLRPGGRYQSRTVYAFDVRASTS